MPTCIYCLESKSGTGFRRREHVLPQSFGRFKPSNLTLRGAVCDDCNQLFGNTIELHLARDTPHGLNRYLIGRKEPSEFKPPRKTSSVVIRLNSGPFKGAFVAHRAGEGIQELKPLPQVGFGKSKAGPFMWFLVEKLPTPEELRALLEDGRCHVKFVEVDDSQSVDKDLQARGLNLSEVIETAVLPMSRENFEMSAQLGMEFGRAISKIGFNYFAHEYGAQAALMPNFDIARRFVRHGSKPEERRIWDQLPQRVGTWPPGHRIAIEWIQLERSVTAMISFHDAALWYRVTLGADFIVVPTDKRAHFFDLKSMTVRRIK